MSTESVTSNPLKVLIIGTGNIAGGFDQGRPNGYLPYTHAGAYSQDGRFSITACVEPDDNRRKEFMKTWKVEKGFKSLNQLVNSNEIFDVISICSPTECHANDIEIALSLKPKIIFCEKPITPSLAKTQKVVRECSKAKIPLVVNYTRRWDPDISKLQKEIQDGQWGKLRTVLGTYNKGILNNGSHMLDLLNLFVGPIEIVKVGEPVDDYFHDDPTIPVWLEGNQGLPIYLACGHAEDYALFELQFIFSHGVLIMEEGGMFWHERHVKKSTTFKGYHTLDKGVRRTGEYPHAMLKAIDNIYSRINYGQALASTGETALSAQRLCEEVKHLACS